MYTALICCFDVELLLSCSPWVTTAVLSTGSDEQDKPQTLEMQMSTTVESSAVVTNLSSSAAMETGVDFPPATDKPEQDAECMSDSQTLASHSVCNVCAASMEEQERMQLSESEEPAQPVQTLSISEEEQHRREATPEELANLGKAVDMVQARSCQLSPSLLTVGQTPPDMDSPARHAFERGGHVCLAAATIHLCVMTKPHLSLQTVTYNQLQMLQTKPMQPHQARQQQQQRRPVFLMASQLVPCLARLNLASVQALACHSTCMKHLNRHAPVTL